jgi:hypothetical protein
MPARPAWLCKSQVSCDDRHIAGQPLDCLEGAVRPDARHVSCSSKTRGHKIGNVTPAEIVREIERLPSNEKAEVLSVLLRSQPKISKLSPEELVALADQMIAAQDSEEADRLEARILAGFYGR